MWSIPVGLGAKRTRTDMGLRVPPVILGHPGGPAHSILQFASMFEDSRWKESEGVLQCLK